MKHLTVPALVGITLGSIIVSPSAMAIESQDAEIGNKVNAIDSSIPTFEETSDIERVSHNAVAPVTVAVAKSKEDKKQEIKRLGIERASFTAEAKPEPKPEVVEETSNTDDTVESTTDTSNNENSGNDSVKARTVASNATSDAYTSDSRQGVKKTYKDNSIELDYESEGTGMEAVVKAAYSGVGNPYVWGGNTPAGWDCSGFTKWAYAKAGINIQRTTSSILASGQFKRTSTPQPGDLVFQNGGKHVGIYVGDGKMIGAQNPSVGTILHSVNRNPVYGYYTLKN